MEKFITVWEKFITVSSFLTMVIVEWYWPAVEWVKKHPDLWTEEIGYLPWLIIIVFAVLFPKIYKEIKQWS